IAAGAASSRGPLPPERGRAELSAYGPARRRLAPCTPPAGSAPGHRQRRRAAAHRAPRGRRMKLVIFLPFLLLPLLVGSAAASVAAALPSAGATPLFAWVPAGGYPDHFPFGQCTWWAAYNHRV